MAITEETKKLIDKDNLELGIGMHLAGTWLSKQIGEWSDEKYIVARCKLKVSDFKPAFRDETIVNRIMPLVAENVAQAYGVPLWLRGKKPKEYFMEKFWLTGYHYELIERYISRVRISEIRNTMEASYNSSSQVATNPMLRTDINTIEPIGHTINLSEDTIKRMNEWPNSVLESVNV